MNSTQFQPPSHATVQPPPPAAGCDGNCGHCCAAVAAADQLATADRLATFERIGAELWPYVRHFGLCGAEPAAVVAAIELGKLLGHGCEAAVPADVADDAVAAAQANAVTAIADWLESAPEVLAKCGSKIASAIAAMLRDARRV